MAKAETLFTLRRTYDICGDPDETSVTMYSEFFQSLILHITCMRFDATLAKPKHVGNAFTYLNLFLQTKRLYDCYTKEWLAHFSRYCTSHLLSLT